MKRFWSDDERRTHRVERQFLKIITCLFREDLINHESLVASPGSLQLPRGGEPKFGLTVHDVPVRRVSTSVCNDVSAHTEPDAAVLFRNETWPFRKKKKRKRKQ